MTLQFSIIGYAVIAFFYIISAAFLLALWVRRDRYRWVKTVLVVVVPIVLVLPWAEELWIAWNFAKLCEGAGVHVMRKVEVDGYFNATTTGPARPELITDPRRIASYEGKGYRFVERKADYGADAKVSHVEKDADGQWAVTILDSPQARYHYQLLRQDSLVSHKLTIIERAVTDTEDGSIIGRSVIYKRYPNIIEWQWIRFFGTGMSMCPDPEKGPHPPSFPQAVLIPAKKG